MTKSHGNRDTKTLKAPNLDDKFIREFDRMIKEMREFNREQKRKAGGNL